MWLSPAACAQSDAPEINFVVRQEGDEIRIEAEVDLQIERTTAWAVLTDYEGYPRYISSLRSSKIVSHTGDEWVIDQKGDFSFLFFSQKIAVRKVVSEFAPHAIESRAIDGDFQLLIERYALQPIEKGVRLSYSGRLIPKFKLPALFGLPIVRHILLSNFQAMLDEMRRRDQVLRRSDASAPG